MNSELKRIITTSPPEMQKPMILHDFWHDNKSTPTDRRWSHHSVFKAFEKEKLASRAAALMRIESTHHMMHATRPTYQASVEAHGSLYQDESDLIEQQHESQDSGRKLMLQRPGKEEASSVVKSDSVQIQMTPMTSRKFQITSMMKDSFTDDLEATGSKIFSAPQGSIIECKNEGLHVTKLPVTELQHDPEELLPGHQELPDLVSMRGLHKQLRSGSIHCARQELCLATLPLAVTELQGKPEEMRAGHQSLPDLGRVTRLHESRVRLSQFTDEEVCTSGIPISELQGDPKGMLHSSASGSRVFRPRFQDRRTQNMFSGEEMCIHELPITELQDDPGHQAVAVPGHQAVAVPSNSSDGSVHYSMWAWPALPDLQPGDSVSTLHSSNSSKRMSYSGISLRNMQQTYSFARDLGVPPGRVSQTGAKPKSKTMQVHPL